MRLVVHTHPSQEALDVLRGRDSAQGVPGGGQLTPRPLTSSWAATIGALRDRL
jgi:hypothetical protein